MIPYRYVLGLSLLLVTQSTAQQPGDNTRPGWPLFGGSPTRNMVNLIDRNMPIDWCVEENKEKNVKWKAKLGRKSYAGPVVAGGRIFVCTNNTNRKEPQSVLMCFRETDGDLLWQVRHPGPKSEIFDHVIDMGLLSTPRHRRRPALLRPA